MDHTKVRRSKGSSNVFAEWVRMMSLYLVDKHSEDGVVENQYSRCRLHAETRIRHGVTIVEVLVIIAVMSLLIALLLPAVQAARRTALSIQCKNNLYQIGRALHEFESQHGAFPDASYAKQLLPHLDQKALFERINADNVMHGILVVAHVPSCPKLSGAAVPVYACPEDSLQQGINGLALNYLLNKGTGYGGYDDGFMKSVAELKPKDISDGLSNTVAISEKLLSSRKKAFGEGLYHPTTDEALRNYASTDRFSSPSQRGEFLNACSTNVVWLKDHGPRPCTPQGNCLPHLLNLLMPPNSHSCMNGFHSFDWDPARYGALTATSLHSGGVHTLFADGSVRFVANNVHVPLWQAIGTRNGGEVAF